MAIGTGRFHDSGWVTFYWGGPDFDTLPDFEIRNASSYFGQHLVPVGDFNADGYEDIYIAGGSNAPYGVYFGGPEFDDKLDVIIDIARAGGYIVTHSAQRRVDPAAHNRRPKSQSAEASWRPCDPLQLVRILAIKSSGFTRDGFSPGVHSGQ